MCMIVALSPASRRMLDASPDVIRYYSVSGDGKYPEREDATAVDHREKAKWRSCETGNNNGREAATKQ